MASVKLESIIEKMKLENLTPDIDISKIKITQPDINRPALQLAGCGIFLYRRTSGGKEKGDL